jgi:6-phospho-3-hexuloisomerase
MPPFSKFLSQVLAEIHSSVEAVSSEAFQALLTHLINAPQVFVTGQGRTGLMARAFAMRLAQLGCTTYVVGETTIPPIRRGDVFVACSGSGETLVTYSYAERAKNLGAVVLAVTGRASSRLATLAHVCLLIPTPDSEQLGNARFEQALLIVLDLLALAYAERLDIPPATIWENHANLE